MSARKRKKSKSPNPTTNIEEKKVRSDKEAIKDVQSTTVTPIASHPSTLQEQNKPVKPIYVTANIQDTKKVISLVKIASKVLCKIRGTNCTQVSCFNIQDKRILIEKLKSEGIEFYTFTEKCEKSNKFIMKGFYDVTNEKLLQMLKKEDVPAIKVTDFIRKNEFTWYLVHFDKTATVDLFNQLSSQRLRSHDQMGNSQEVKQECNTMLQLSGMGTCFG